MVGVPFSSTNDLVNTVLHSGSTGPGVQLRQGQISFWDPATLDNRVIMGGVELVNVQMLSVGPDIVDMQPGDVVTLMSNGLGQIFIVGRVVTPGTSSAQRAIQSAYGRVRSATVATTETATSGSYVDLTTYGPEVKVSIGPSGSCLLTVSANMTIPNGGEAAMSFVGSGPGSATEAASDARGVGGGAGLTTVTGPVYFKSGRPSQLTGLAMGEWVFTAKYRVISSPVSGSITFGARNITATPA